MCTKYGNLLIKDYNYIERLYSIFLKGYSNTKQFTVINQSISHIIKHVIKLENDMMCSKERQRKAINSDKNTEKGNGKVQLIE